MLLPMLVALAAQDPSAFTQPLNVVEPNRIALTPTIDGTISPEEWDVFTSSGNAETFLQWENGKLHVAAKIPYDQELVLSLDLKGNGWLVGKDNIEFRFQPNENRDLAPMVSARRLDATKVDAPVWVPIPGFTKSSKLIGRTEAGVTTIEATIEDPGLGMFEFKDQEKLMARLDVVPGNAGSEPFLPRAGVPLKLVTERGTALPMGFKWNAEPGGRVVTPGETSRVRVTFNGKDSLNLKRIELRSEGVAREHTSLTETSFPNFDRKDRAFVDYHTNVAPEAAPGTRVLRATITPADGAPVVVQTSYRIAPHIEVDLPRPNIDVKHVPQTVRMSFYLRSNSVRGMEGKYTVTAPEGWIFAEGGSRSFKMFNGFSNMRQVFDISVPANTQGTFPFVFKVEAQGKTVEHTRWITID